MPTQKRAPSQTVEAIPMPLFLRELSIAKATEMRLAKAGFYRYAIARAVGFSEDDARDFGLAGNLFRRITEARKLTTAAAGNNTPDSGEVLTPSEEHQERVLTNYPLAGNTIPVKPILPSLIERLRKATEERGRKTELAAWLGTSPQKVSDWLSARVEPSGETTLRLLQWVGQEERKQQQKSPASVTAPAEPKAQVIKQHENENNSGPPPG